MPQVPDHWKRIQSLGVPILISLLFPLNFRFNRKGLVFFFLIRYYLPMPKKLLLVDDEVLFLESLQEGLEPLADLVEVDICHSVNEAIKLVITNNYDLIITDMRMPGKSGLELLMYLRESRFKGKLMVMSAYNTRDSIRKINSLGVVDVISKPFNLAWIKDKLKEILAPPENEDSRQAQVTFDSINLLAVMQIVNMEGNTSALEVEYNDGKGVIYFEKGDMVHAVCGPLEGEEALVELASHDESRIFVKGFQEDVRHTIEKPFVEQMINITKIMDEQKHLQQSAPSPSPEPAGPQVKDLQTSISEKMDVLKGINGYLGAGIFTPHGEMLVGHWASQEDDRLGEMGALVHSILKNAKGMADKIGFGSLDLLQLYTQGGIVFATCYSDEKTHFHTILVIQPEGNIVMARMQLEKAVTALIPEL